MVKSLKVKPNNNPSDYANQSKAQVPQFLFEFLYRKMFQNDFVGINDKGPIPPVQM